MDITIEDDIHIVKLIGNLNILAVDEIQNKLTSIVNLLKTPKVIFDMSELDHISSSIVRVILNFYKKIESKGGKVNFFGMKSNVYKIISLMELENILINYSSLEEAKSHL